jgi:hypothetical protein
MIYGQGVQITEALPAQLEAELTSRVQDYPLEVVNLGHCGYSVHDMYYRLWSEGIRYRPNLVLLFINHTDPQLRKCKVPTEYVRHVLESWNPSGSVFSVHWPCASRYIASGSQTPP